MTRTLAIGLCALGITVSSARAQDAGKTITVAGCIQQGTSANQFVLANTSDPISKGVAATLSGAVPTVNYILSGGENLAAHLGHRVEITGTTSGKAEKAATAESSVQEQKTSGSKPDTKVEVKEKAAIEVRDLKIASMKMVSTSCAAK